MANPIQFKYGITNLFRIVKCVTVPTGDFYDVPAAPDDAVPIDGSPDLFQCPEILLVTSGSFDLQVPELGTISLQAGDLSSSERYRSSLRIVATSDDSSYVCISPRLRLSFWDRESGYVSQGGSIVVTTPPEATESYVFVAIGNISYNSTDYLVGSLFQVPTGDVTLNGTLGSYFIHIWK